MAPLDPTTRFSDRVQDYARFRPGYPPKLVAAIARHCGKRRSLRVAEFGSGTGLFTRLLLDAGHEVFAVEPNEAMRKEAEAELIDRPLFHSLHGTAEDSGLPAGHFDLVAAAQAFHWFEFETARREFLRILKPGGMVALVWNNRETKSTFGRGYERFLERHSTDYAIVRARGKSAEKMMRRFFGAQGYKVLKFPHSQHFGWDALWGRFLSTSYSPKEGDPRRETARKALRELFDRCARRGQVAMRYRAEAFVGRPA